MNATKIFAIFSLLLLALLAGSSTAAAPLRGPRELPLPAKQIPMAAAGDIAMPQRRLLAYGGYSPAPYGYYSPRVYAAPKI